MSGGRFLALPITERSRSARLRGLGLVLEGFVALRALFTGRTSTSVPSGSALGLSSRTLPFLIFPRTVMECSLFPALPRPFYPCAPYSKSSNGQAARDP